MLRVVATYLGTQENRFDQGYYLGSHLQIAQSLLGPHGLKHVRVLSALEPVAGVGHHVFVVSEMLFTSRSAFEAAMVAKGEDLFNDIVNFTDVTPLVQVCGKLTEA